MHKYIVMGPQGCGKGTQAKMLEKDFDLVHISVGDIFRWQVQHHTKLGAKVKRIVASGLVKKPIDLSGLAKKNGGTFPFDQVAAAIDGRQTTRMHGMPDMPVWGEIFAMTTGTDAPTAELAVKRITHYVWSNQATAAAPAAAARK